MAHWLNGTSEVLALTFSMKGQGKKGRKLCDSKCLSQEPWLRPEPRSTDLGSKSLITRH